MLILETTYEHTPIPIEAYEHRLSQALDLLINVDDIYECIEGQSGD